MFGYMLLRCKFVGKDYLWKLLILFFYKNDDFIVFLGYKEGDVWFGIKKIVIVLVFDVC